MEKYSVDVIIPTYKPDHKFIKLIAGLKNQSYPINKIIVIDTETGTFPEEECRLISNLEVKRIKKEEFDHGGTRNKGASLSKADIMLFMTQDAVPKDSRMLEHMIRFFEDEKVSTVYGRQLPDQACKVIERYTRSFNYPARDQIKTESDISKMGIKAFFCSNVCAAYRKDVFVNMGGFVNKTIFNEDMILAGRTIKAGWKIVYASKAEVIHSHNYRNIEQFHRNFDLAVSQEQHPEVFAGVKSESEGVKLVKTTAGYLWKIKKPWLIPVLIVNSGFKYLGYRLGRYYKKLPHWLILKCTMNQAYWIKS